MHVGETVSVVASFPAGGKLTPVSFKWHGRDLTVGEITYRWETRDGQSVSYHFNVTAGGALYELVFNARSLIWQIESLEA